MATFNMNEEQKTNCSDDGGCAGPSKRAILPRRSKAKIGSMAESPDREAKQHKRSKQEPAENPERPSNAYADRRPEDVEHWNCKGMSNEEIIGTYDQFKDELYELFKKYKNTTFAYCVQMGLCSFWDCIDLMTEDQHSLMVYHLDVQYIPREEWTGEYTNFLVKVLSQEWVLRIFMQLHNFSDREAALKRIREEDRVLMGKLSDDHQRNFSKRYNLKRYGNKASL